MIQENITERCERMLSKIRRILKNINYKRYDDGIREIDYENLKELIKSDTDIDIVDIRSPQEFEEKRIRNSINIPLYDLKKKAECILNNKNKLIVLCCGCGIRSKKAYKILEEKGYSNLYSLKGGIDEI